MPLLCELNCCCCALAQRNEDACHASTHTRPSQTVRGWYIAMEQYSSLCGAAVVDLGVVDIGDGVPGRVQVECGREEVNDGEKQEKDRTRKQPTDNQTHTMDDMKME